MSDKVDKNPGYEKRDVSPIRIIIFGVIGMIIVVVAVTIVVEVFITTSEKLVEEMVLEPQSTAIRDLRARETEELNTYKLLDSNEGIYRIPIDRAIELMADEAYRKKIN